MQYCIITNIILVLFFSSFIFLLYQWLQDINCKELTFILLFSLCLAFIFKFSSLHHFFGLEYEDSYIFNFSARQLYENVYPISFLTDGITAGSLSNPVLTNTYGGHFITYPVLISWAYHIFGYNIYLPSYLNTFIEFLTILTLSLSFRNVFGFKKNWYIPGVIYCLAPAMNVFANTHLSETFSSFIVLISILSFFNYFKSYNKITLLVFGISFLTAILTKRENAILLCLFLVYSAYQIIIVKQRKISNLLPIITSIVIIFIYLIFIQNVFLIEKTESAEISTLTFSLSNLTSLIPVFIKALMDYRWFNIYLVLFTSSIVFILYNWKRSPIQMSILGLYFSYFIIYTLHYRSYYFIHFGDIAPFDSLRYLNNFFVISTLIISFFLCELLNIFSIKKMALSIFAILVAVSFITTSSLRKEFSDIEKEERFLNPTYVLNYLSGMENSVLITDNILIYQLLGDKDLELIDLYILDNFPNELKSKNTYLFLTNFSKTEYFQYRFPNIFKMLQMIKKHEIILFGNDDSLYKIELQ